MKTFKVVMKEKGCSHELVQTAVCENRRQVIEWYGLNEADIEYYRISEVA